MKHRLQTFLRHKLQWLVLLTALLGVSQEIWSSANIYIRYNGTNWKDVACNNECYIFLDASTTYPFKIHDDYRYYGLNNTITNNIENWWIKSSDNNNVQITTSNAGYYKFFHYGWKNGDTNGYYELNVHYPSGFNIKYGWNNSSWSWQTMTRVGSTNVFRYEGKYGTATTVDLGFDDNNKYNRSFTSVGSPSSGNDCIFLVDTKGTGKTPSEATVTVAKKVYSIIGYAADNTDFTTWYSMTSSGSYYYFDCNTNGTFKFSDCATYDAGFYNQFSNKSNSDAGAVTITNQCSSDKNCTLEAPPSGYTYPIRVWIDPSSKKIWATATASSCSATEPTLSATPPTATNITCSSVTLGGDVTSKGINTSCSAQTLKNRGVKIYSNSACTEGYLVKTVDHATADATGPYTVNVTTGLTAGTTYYYKSYAKNDTGTSYSSNYISFTTVGTPSAADISITAPSVKTIIYTGTGNTPSTSAQTITATCSKGDTYLWTAAPSTLSYSGAWGSGTASRVSIASSSSQSTTATFYHEGVYTATFNAGCGNTTDASKTSKTFVVRPGYMYIAGTLLDNSWTFYDSRRVAINTSDSTFTYEWDAAYTSGQFLASVGNRCGEAETSAYTISNYATLTLNNITKDTGGNHNLNPNIGTITVGDKLKLKIEYTGVDGSGVPKYTLTLNKVPVPTTDEPDNITWTQAKLWGTYPKTSEYASISTSESGFYYGTTSSPATKVYNGSQTAGRLAITIKNLTPGTTYYYKAFVVSDGVEYCGAVESFNTTACSNPTISTQPYNSATREYCKDDASPASLTVAATGGVGEYTYQWKQCATSGGTYTNVSAGTGGTTAEYTPSTATAGDLYYKCVVTNKSICTSNSVTSNASCKYKIDAASVAGTISGGNTSVCSGTTKNLTLGSYTGSIQWHSSSTSGFTPSSTTAISGARSATYAAPINTVGTKYYKAVVTNGVCPAATTASQSYITVKPNAASAQYTLSNNTQTYVGAPRTVTVTPATGAGDATVYYSNASYAKSTTGPINAGTYTVTVDAANGTNYCAASDINVGTLTINKANQSTLTISNTLTDFAYCSGASTTLTTSGGSGSGAVTYTITSGSGTIDGSTLSATAKNSITVTATKAASQNYNATTSAGKVFNFTQNPPTAYDISADVTSICSGGGGTITLANSQTGYNYLLYNNGTPLDEDIKAGTGSEIDFDVTSSGVYTAKGYYGTNMENCLTDMNESVVMTISTTPKLVRSAQVVTNYTPVTITSVSTDIETWTITGTSNAYVYDKTENAITFKGNSTDSPYTITARTHGGCENTTTVTVTDDTESCN